MNQKKINAALAATNDVLADDLSADVTDLLAIARKALESAVIQAARAEISHTVRVYAPDSEGDYAVVTEYADGQRTVQYAADLTDIMPSTTDLSEFKED